MRKEKSLFSWVLAGHGLDYFRSRDEWNLTERQVINIFQKEKEVVQI